MREMRGPITVNYPKLTVLRDRLDRNTRAAFHGTQARVPLVLSWLPHGGLVAEGGTVNEPGKFDSTHAIIKLCRLVQPMAITDELLSDSANTADTSWREAAATYIEQATVALSRTQNFLMHGDGNALIAAVTSAGSASTTVTVGTAANFYFLKPGAYVDVRVRATGALITNGQRRKITATNPAAGTVTVDVALTTATTDGLYLEGSYGDPVGYQGLAAALTQTGTFQSVNRATYPQWKAVDGRAGTTTEVDLSEVIVDGMERRLGEESGKTISWMIGDPAVLDRYSHTHLAFQRFAGEQFENPTGFKAVGVNNKPLFGDFDHEKNKVTGFNESAVSIYAATEGPDWWQFPGGSMWNQFNRSFAQEAWLHDRSNLGWHQLNCLTYADDLARAS